MNPIILRKGVCDPHIHIFEGKAYLYATHDAPGYGEDFHMDDWQIWSSENLIDWQQEAAINPESFYCGSLNQCWALDAAYKNGKYYLYFSTGDWGVGVAVSKHPAGPFEDARAEALVDYREHPVGVPKWDPCVFQDDDGCAYLIVGTCKQEEPWDCYLIAKLEKDMVHLAEPLRRLEYIGNPWPEDKASIHKYGGKYYLTHSSYYAVSNQIYGPYQYVGNTGCNIDHGSFFCYHNQTYFASGGMDNASRYLRASFLAPCHYHENGEISIDQKPMQYGCGQYDGTWNRIEASWYFAASRGCKEDDEEGRVRTVLFREEYLYFPNISNIEADSRIEVLALAKKGGLLTIREGSSDGAILGTINIKAGEKADIYSGRLICGQGQKSLYLVADSEIELYWFCFPSKNKRYMLEPVFSRLGRGASLAFDQDASNHQILQNMELKGAAMEALADGGAGGTGCLSIPYVCTGADTTLDVYVNHIFQGKMRFPVTGISHLGKQPCMSKLAVDLQPGLNRIRICSEEYQTGRLSIDHILVESRQTDCNVYAAANGVLEPRGNGCWDGFPQRETDLEAYGGRIVKYLEKPGDEIKIEDVAVEKSGDFLLKIHYCRGEAGKSTYLLLVNDEEVKTLDFESTGQFLVRAMQEYTINIKMNKGSNTLTLRKTGQQDQGIFVDAFAVSC